MRLVQAGCVAAAAMVLLCGLGAACGVQPGGLVLGVGSLLQSPTSAFYAAAQLAAPPLATPVVAQPPTPAPTALPAPTAALPTAPIATPAPMPAPGSLLGAVALIPDTGAPPGTGAVVEQFYPNGSGDTYLALGAGTLRNMTNLSNDTVQHAIAEGMPFAIQPNSTEPQVLIMHTHATETYRPYQGLYYDLDSTARTTDKTRSVCAVGAIVAQTLNDAGICTLHDTTLNDYPSYNDSYDNSHEVVAAYLAQYPSIKVVIDVHRDALQNDENWYAPVCQINGQQSAQVMMIAGCDNGGSIALPNCMQNLAFAAAWQATLEGSYPGLTRSAMFKYKYYNQDLTTGSLLLEVGGHGNTLNEALYAGQLAAQGLANLLLG